MTPAAQIHGLYPGFLPLVWGLGVDPQAEGAVTLSWTTILVSSHPVRLLSRLDRSARRSNGSLLLAVLEVLKGDGDDYNGRCFYNQLIKTDGRPWIHSISLLKCHEITENGTRWVAISESLCTMQNP